MNTFRPGPTARSALRIAGLLFALILAFSIAMAVPMVGASTEATVTPTDEPAAAPTDEPTAAPTDEPAAVPTDEPAAAPTDEPAVEPAVEPTAAPTDEPAVEQAVEPTAAPTDEPAVEPAVEPTAAPIGEPTAAPTDELAAAPTDEPTAMPTEAATETPTEAATETPTATATSTPTPSGPPTIASDKDDYPPGGLVTLTGANWQGDAEVRIVVNDDVGQIWRRDVPVTVAADGTIYDSFNLPFFFVANYRVAATGQQTGRVATTTFTDKPAANLDQCANLGTTCDTGTSSQWQNGNLGQSQATYFEGDSVPYRAVVTGLVAGATYTLKIEYDTTQSGKHALDYLTNFDRTETTADPCSGVAGVPSCASSTFPIPLDSNVSGGGVTQLPGQNFTIYNGAITGVSGYTLSGTYAGSSSTSIIVTFTATAAGTSVLAWGGHIATRADWGLNNSAVAISGSPYHMRLTDFTCSNVSNCGVGNQDRSLSADAVIFPASITIIKDAVPDDAQDIGFSTSGGLSPASFSLDDDADGTLSNTQLYSNILVTTNTGNNYTVIEATVAGWTLSLANPPCVVTSPNSGSSSASGSTVSINLREGENLTCTFTNTRQAAHLIVIKHVVNDNGGTAVASAFTMSVTGSSPSPASFAGAESPGTTVTLSPGSYSVSETGPSGYSSSFSADCSGSIAAGQTKTCTVTNDDQAATLIVIKHVINDNGGTATAGNFTLDSGGTNDSPDDFAGAEAPGTTVTLDAGSYNVTESGPSGYTASFSADCLGSIANGQTKTCTVTNDDQAATLIVIKHVINDNGGTVTAADFTLDSGGTNDSPDDFAGAEAPGTSVTLDAGSYSVTETGPSGYTRSDTADCAGTIANGETKTCTITNDDNAATLIVIKHVINDNGGTATAGNFTLDSGGANDSPDDFAGAEAPGTTVTLDAGSYNVTETGPSGYSADFSADCAGTIANGETKTCTVTNDDKAATLIVIKHVINDNGGSAVAADFTMSVTGGNVQPNSSFPGAESPGTTVTLNAGSYSVSENSVLGYTSDGGSADCSGTIANGETKTCTITNDDVAPTLTLIKIVVNDDGGNAVVSDFPLFINGNSVTSGAANTLSANTLYTASETTLAGYTPSVWGGDCNPDGTITLNEGDSKTCTITNDDVAPTLKLVKNVNNADGGNAQPDDWTLSAAAAAPFDGRNFSNAGGSGAFETVFANADYDLSESTVSGYTAGSWSCDGGALVGSTITLAEGETGVTCTITNDDVAPTLKLVKIVTNDDGGNAVADDWTLSADASAPNDGRNFSNLGGSGVFETVFANTGYDLSESTVAGYTAGSWSCDGGSLVGSTVTLAEGQTGVTCTITNDDIVPKLTLIKTVVNDNDGTAQVSDFPLFIDSQSVTSGAANTVQANVEHTASETTLTGYAPSAWGGDCAADGTITLLPGDNKTCTITNDDVQPQLIVIKHVINDNGGDKDASDFTMTVDGNSPSPATFPGDENGTPVAINVGGYTVFEDGQPGYTASYSADCVGSLNPGDVKTCIITNDDIAPKLTLIKTVVNDNGGDAQPDDFNLTIGGNPALSGTAYTLSANTPYAINETQLPGYTFVDITGDPECPAVLGGTVTLDEGETVTCTITNDDVAPTLTLIKNVVNDDGGDAVVSDIPLFINGNSVTSGAANTLSANTLYTASETTLAGYTPSVWGGDCNPDGTITLNEGQVATCTITNDDVAPTLKLVKEVSNDDGGNAVTNDWTLSADVAAPFDSRNFSNAGGSGAFETVFANADYDLSESTVSGYTAGSWSCDGGTLVGSTITLAEGETGVTCTITNDDDAPTLTLIKVVVNNNGGNAGPNDFGISVDGTVVQSGVPSTLDANTPYAIDEAGLSGYQFVSITGDPECPAVLGGTVTLDEGEDVTCTITNDDVAPTLTLVKTVINDDGGTKQVSDFPLFVNATPVTSGAANGFNAGSYTASETQQYGYTAGSWGGDCAANGSVTLSVGDNKTCTITNDDQPGTIIVQKIIKPVGSLTSFSFNTTGTGYTTFSLAGGGTNSQTLSAGSYTVKELVPLGWVLTGIGGSSDPNTPYNCTITGSGGSTGVGDLTTQTATISLKNGDTVTCVFENTGQGVTRTQGFWATHTPLANIAWFGGTAFGHTFPGVAATAGIGDNLICGRPIDTLGKLMGAFWSDISKTSTGTKRSALDQARMQLLQQLIAAELNASAFGSVPIGGSGRFATWESALCGTSTTAIKNAQQEAASFNTQGDSGTFTPGTSADSKNARAIATYTFWDVLP